LSAACFSSKASEMYLRKMRPSTTCLYSAASMLLRSLSAACQSLASKPRVAPFAAGPGGTLPAPLVFGGLVVFEIRGGRTGGVGPSTSPAPVKPAAPRARPPVVRPLGEARHHSVDSRAPLRPAGVRRIRGLPA